jgi:type IV pilus assembly protein PilB
VSFPGLARLTPFQTEMIALRMLRGDVELTRTLLKNGSVDLSYSIPQKTRFRVNIFSQRGTYAIVLRVIPEGVPTLESLKLPEELHNICKLKNGIVLVTGPTGSGKTTTLYSALRMVQSDGVNIVTVEDPVEYRLGKGIVQVQVHEKAGLTFAAALRSILRQDPDVVLVGEVRDRETAQIALQASLTGHLVLSTLHTNDAPNAITRLVDMGMEPYKIGPALRGVIAQRLMRRICPRCREINEGDIPTRIKRYIPQGTTLYRAVGCPDCAMTGYRGRFSVVEILTMNAELERRIGAGGMADKIAEAAKANGMKSLFESGLQHVLSGDTSVEELLRVVDVPMDERSAGRAAPPSTNTPLPPKRSTPGAHRGTPATPSAPFPAVNIPVADLTTAFDLIDDEAAVVEAVRPVHGASVLLVDDEDSLRRVMKDLLGREGYAVIEARNGVEALDQVDRHAPDVVVLDLNLPDMDGYAVLSQLRSRPATRKTPVIVLTAKGDEDNEVRVFELGADDFLTKPFRAKALSKRLEVVLARKKE